MSHDDEGTMDARINGGVHPIADIGFVDAHIHLYDLRHEHLRYSWLEDDAVHPILGDIDAIKTKRYDLTAFTAETRFSGVTQVVHVQAALGSPDPVEETAWVNLQAERSDLAVAIVGEAHLQDADVEETLERHAAFPRFRGVRDFGRGNYWRDPAFERGLAKLARFGMSFDADAAWEDMTAMGELAGRHPNVLFVLEHAGSPLSQSPEYIESWFAAMRQLARHENVVCKISGLGMYDPAWTVSSLRPRVEACLEAFGIERCMFATNWPVDRLFSSYTDLLLAYHAIVAGLSEAERRQLFVTNAQRYYRF
jgi:predicted TIM-barrel fold metal-dependent hydrolase